MNKEEFIQQKLAIKIANLELELANAEAEKAMLVQELDELKKETEKGE